MRPVWTRGVVPPATMMGFGLSRRLLGPPPQDPAVSKTPVCSTICNFPDKIWRKENENIRPLLLPSKNQFGIEEDRDTPARASVAAIMLLFHLFVCWKHISCWSDHLKWNKTINVGSLHGVWSTADSYLLERVIFEVVDPGRRLFAWLIWGQGWTWDNHVTRTSCPNNSSNLGILLTSPKSQTKSKCDASVRYRYSPPHLGKVWMNRVHVSISSQQYLCNNSTSSANLLKYIKLDLLCGALRYLLDYFCRLSRDHPTRWSLQKCSQNRLVAYAWFEVQNWRTKVCNQYL